MTFVAESRLLWVSVLCVFMLVSGLLSGTVWVVVLLPAWCVLGYTGPDVWSKR